MKEKNIAECSHIAFCNTFGYNVLAPSAPLDIEDVSIGIDIKGAKIVE